METITCNRCAREFLTTDSFCPGCGLAARAPSSEVLEAKPKVSGYDAALLGLPFIGTMLAWFWVGNMNLLQSPQSYLMLIGLATVIGTAIITKMDADKIGLVANDEKGTNSPNTWAAFVLIFWIIGYPMYLYRRKKYGVANHVGAGILLAFIFSGSIYFLNDIFESKRQEILQAFKPQPVPEMPQQIQVPQQNFAQTAIDNTLAEYEIANKNNDKMNMCGRAGTLVELMLQAKDEDGYKQWKKTQKTDCRAAGIPME